MSIRIKQKNCPCSKGEYCTNGLKCTEGNCFLLKGSTFVTKPPETPIESLNPIRSILASDYRQSHSFYLNIRGSDDATLDKNDGSTELNYALK